MSAADKSSSSNGRSVHANGLDTHIEEYGDGNPLLLLHGGTATSSMWKSYVPLLSEYFRVILIDIRGHGRTNNPAGRLSYRLMADDLSALIDAIGLEKPFVFGYSDGGQIAIELGMHYPGLSAALVAGAIWYRSSESMTRFLREYGLTGPGQVDFRKIEAANPEMVQFMRANHRHEEDPEYWQALLKQISTMWWTPLDYTESDFRRISEATLIMIGDRDGIIPITQAVEMYEAIPNAELAILPNATHFDAISRTSVSLVIDFLVRHNP